MIGILRSLLAELHLAEALDDRRRDRNRRARAHDRLTVVPGEDDLPELVAVLAGRAKRLDDDRVGAEVLNLVRDDLAEALHDRDDRDDGRGADDDAERRQHGPHLVGPDRLQRHPEVFEEHRVYVPAGAVAHVADDLPVLQANHARGVLGQLVLVRHEDDRVAAAVQIVHQGEDLLARLRVQVSRRLVGEQDRRLVHERTRDRDALALAARHLVRPVMHAGAQAHRVERFFGPRFPLPARQARIDERQLDVLDGVRAREEVERLEDEADLLVADLRQLVVVHRRDLAALQVVRAGRRRVEASDQVHQGGLPGPRRTHDRDVVAALDRQRHAGQGVDDRLRPHLVGFRHVADIDERAQSIFTSAFAPSRRPWIPRPSSP